MVVARRRRNQFQERAGKPGAKESSCKVNTSEPCQPSITKASYSLQGGY